MNSDAQFFEELPAGDFHGKADNNELSRPLIDNSQRSRLASCCRVLHAAAKIAKLWCEVSSGSVSVLNDFAAVKGVGVARSEETTWLEPPIKGRSRTTSPLAKTSRLSAREPAVLPLYVPRDEYAPLTTSLPSSSINVWQSMAAARLPTAFADKQSFTTTYLATRD